MRRNPVANLVVRQRCLPAELCDEMIAATADGAQQPHGVGANLGRTPRRVLDTSITAHDIVDVGAGLSAISAPG